MRIPSVTTATIVALVVTGCGGKGPIVPESSAGATNQLSKEVTLDDVGGETAEAIGAALELADQTKDEYIRSAKASIEEIDQRVTALRSKGEALTDDALQAWHDRLKELAGKRKAVQNKLSDIGASTGDAWRELAQGLVEAKDDLSQALERAEAEFKGQPAEKATPKTGPDKE
jgi:hypothetical protein